MARTKKAQLKNIVQISVVVKDLYKSMQLYWELLGIGHWYIMTFQPPAMTNTRVRGKPVKYSMKLAVARIGNIQWELIQP